MNLHDLKRLKSYQEDLLHIADSLEEIRERNRGRRLLGLIRVVVEMHDHQAKLTDIIHQNAPKTAHETADFNRGETAT